MKILSYLVASLLLVNPAVAQQKPTKPKSQKELKAEVGFLPARIDATAKAGETISQTVAVYNGTGTEATIQLEVLPVKTTEDGNFVIPKAEIRNKGKKLTPQPFPDIKVSEKSFSMKDKATKQVQLIITVPKNAKGSYFFMYSANAVNKDMQVGKDGSKKSAGVSFKLNVFSPGIVTIEGTEKADLTLKPTVKYVKESGKISVRVQTSNSGNNFLRELSTSAVLVGSKKEVLAKVKLQGSDDRMNLVPKTKKMFMGNIDYKLPKGEYEVLVTTNDKDNRVVKTVSEKIKVP